MKNERLGETQPEARLELTTTRPKSAETVPLFPPDFMKAVEKHPGLKRIADAIIQVHTNHPLQPTDAGALFSYAVWSEDPEILPKVAQLAGLSERQAKKNVERVIDNMYEEWDLVGSVLDDNDDAAGKIMSENNEPETVARHSNRRRRAEVKGFDFDVEMLRKQGLNNHEIARRLHTSSDNVRDAAHRLILAGRIKPLIERPLSVAQQRTARVDKEVKRLMD